MSLIRVDQRAAGFSETLEAAAIGEYWALESLAAEYLPKLTEFAKARGANDPQGMAGSVMMELFGRLDRLQFDAPAQMWAYLYRTLRCRVIDEHRSHKPVEFHENQSIEVLLPESSGFDDEVIDRQLVDDLLDRLTNEQREILEMRFLHDLSIEETATRTGRTQTAVKGLQRRAIRSLSTAAVILAILAFGGAMWAIMNGNNADNTTVSVPAASNSADGSSDGSSKGSDEPLEVQPTETDSSKISTVDESSAPSVRIVEAPDEGAEFGSSEFRFVATDATGDAPKFECRLDVGDYTPCVSPKMYSDLEAGNHVFLVRALDEDEPQSPALHVWTIKGPPDSANDVVVDDQTLAGKAPASVDDEAAGSTTTVAGSGPSTTARQSTTVASTVKEQANTQTKVEQLRASSVVYECARVSGTYVELEALGYDVTIGGKGDNRIDVRRGSKPDFVVTYGGNDSIQTGSGNDLVCSGDGNDTIDSGPGDDIVSASGGNDTIEGGPGDDRIWGGSGNDTLRGGEGKDKLNGQQGTDTLHGNENDDRLDGGTGLDWLDGGKGKDLCDNGSTGQPADIGCELEPEAES